MKWSTENRRKRRIAKRNKKKQWHKWFTWFPVPHYIQCKWAWLCTIERKKTGILGYLQYRW